MTRARVWGWGDDPDLVGKNVAKYVNKRWGSATLECSITATCRERAEGTLFDISAYLSQPEKAGKLADYLFSVALTGDSKVYFIEVEFYDYMASEEKKFRNHLPTVKRTYEEHRRILTERFRNHPEVKSLLEVGRELSVSFPIVLSCELNSKYVNKVIVEITAYDFQHGVGLFSMLNQRLIEKEIAAEVVGYELGGDLEKLEIDDIYVENEKVYLMLAYPAVK